MIWLVVLQYFFLRLKKKDFIYLFTGEGAEGEREKETDSMRSPTRDSISGFCNHDLSQIQESDAQPTEPPRHPSGNF